MTHILLLDCQEQLFSEIDRKDETLLPILQILQVANRLDISVSCTEQSPKLLGTTLPIIEEQLSDKTPIFSKHTFSSLKTPDIHKHILDSGHKTWILMGLKAHICVLQTARDLIQEGFSVIIPNDAIGAPNLYQLSSAIAELRDIGVRITCSETLIFEWLESDQHEHFVEVNNLLRPACKSCCQH